MTTTISRRRLLQAAGATCGAVALGPVINTRVALADPSSPAAGDALVVVNLRGGLDGLSALVPAGDANYYANRTTVAIPASQCIPIDGTFALHPALAPIAPLYRSGHLAFVPAAGSPDPSRSHFDQQDLLDRGADQTATSGWLARHLLATTPAAALDAAAMVPALPTIMSGYPTAVATDVIERFRLQPLLGGAAPSATTITELVAGSPLDAITRAALAQLGSAASRNPSSYPPQNGAAYEDHPWSDQFRQIAQLMHADVGLRAAVVETVGWDLHAAMGSASAGSMQDKLSHLASAVRAFVTDVADQMDRTTIVLLSEFGRRLAQNGSGGTDHGHGGLMMVIGGGIRGGRVYGDWPGLSPDVLDRGDVQVTTDFRDVLSEIVQRRLGNDQLDVVFPGYSPRFLGLTA